MDRNELIEQRAELERRWRQIEKETSAGAILWDTFAGVWEDIASPFIRKEREVRKTVVKTAEGAARVGVHRLLPSAPVDPHSQEVAREVGLEGEAVTGGSPGAHFRNRLREETTEIAVEAAGKGADTLVTTVEGELAGAALVLSSGAFRGLANAVRAAPDAAKREIVVVGEGMDRVNAVARQLRDEGFTVRTYPAANMNRGLSPNAYGSRRSLDANWHWVDYWARKKQSLVVDIGSQPGRAVPSPYYALESRNLRRWQAGGEIEPLILYDPGF